MSSRPEIERILERAEAATEGPWDQDGRDVCAADEVDCPCGYYAGIHPALDCNSEADATHIATSRTDTPDLARYALELESKLELAHRAQRDQLGMSHSACNCPACTAVRARI